MNLDLIKLNWRIACLYLQSRKIDTSDFERSYNLLASSYDDEWYQYLDRITAEIIAELEEYEFSGILDVGCGTGNSTLKVKNMFPDAHIVGLDFSRPMLKVARQRLGVDKVLLVKDTIEKGLEKFSDKQFDLVLAAWSLGYAKDDNAYKQITRVLKDDGYVLILTNKQDTLKAVRHSMKYTMHKHSQKVQRLPLHQFPPDKQYILSKFNNSKELVKYGEGSISIDISQKTNVVEWLLNTGILAGYEYIVNLRRDEQCRKTYEDFIKSNYSELVHNYMWLLLKNNKASS